jgi:hypothetical protein
MSNTPLLGMSLTRRPRRATFGITKHEDADQRSYTR